MGSPRLHRRSRLLSLGLVAVAMGLGAIGCRDDDVPDPLGANAWTCDCDCDRCIERDPATQQCVRFGTESIPLSVCSNVTCGSADESDPIERCRTNCGYQGCQNIGITLTSCQPNFCQDTSTSSGFIAGAPIQSVLEVDPTRSALVVIVKGRVGVTTVGGLVHLTGGDCPGSTCPMTVDITSLSSPNFEIDGYPVTNNLLLNHGPLEATVMSDGNYLVASGSLYAKFTIDGTLSGIELAPRMLAGANDLASGTLSLVATGTQDDVTIAIFLVASYTNRPPVAVAGPDATVECTSRGRAIVQLDGTASSDPDGAGDLSLFAWLENLDLPEERPLGTGATLEVPLSLGTHDVALLVQDHAGAQTFDHATLNVVDTTPPVIDGIDAPSCVWAPDHGAIRLALGEDIVVRSADACDPERPLVRIVSVRSSDDASWSWRSFTFDASHVCIAAERPGWSPAGRTYTVTLSIADRNGNATTRDVTIAVPHDASRGRCKAVSSHSPGARGC